MNHLCIFVLGAFLAMQLATMPSVYATDPGCNPGFSAFKGHCYLAVAESVPQPVAVNKCHAKSATLASIHSEAEFDFVMGLVKKASPDPSTSFFIGLKLTHNTDNKKLVSCAFTDGTPFDYGECKMNSGKKPWGHFPQNPAEPDTFDGPEVCVAIKSEGGSPGYYDAGCAGGSGVIGYLCKH